MLGEEPSTAKYLDRPSREQRAESRMELTMHSAAAAAGEGRMDLPEKEQRAQGLLTIPTATASFRQSIVFWSGVAVLEPKFAEEFESRLRSRQSPAGKDENCTQSPVS
eukprot:SAG25_NODE_13_length_24452_cov_18.893976_7_plen_108_part_00